MIRLISSIVLLFGTIANAAPVPAKSTPIPAEIPVLATSKVVIQINGFEKTKDKVKTFLKAAFPKEGANWASQLDDLTIQKHLGRELKGVPKDGRMYLAFSEVEELGSNPFAFVFPADDAKALVDGLFPKGKIESRQKHKNGYEVIASESDTYYIIEKPNQVIITGTEELADAYNTKYETLKTKSLGEAVAESFFKSDVSLFINMDAINDHYGEQIKQFRLFFNQMIDQPGVGGPGMDKNQIELIKYTYAGIFQMVEDGKAFVISGELKDNGVAIKFSGRFNPTSPTGKVLANVKSSPLPGLNDLPAGYTIYNSFAMSPELSKMYAKLYREFSASENDEAGVGKLEEWLSKNAQATSNSVANDIGKSTITNIEIPDAAKHVALQIATIKSLGEGATYQNLKLKGKPIVTEADQSLRGMTFHKIELKMDFEETAKMLPAAAKDAIVKSLKFVLPETTYIWVGGKDSRLIQVMATDWAKAKVIIENNLDQKNHAGSDPAIKAIRSLLPNEASYIGLFDIAKGMNFMSEYLPALLSGMQAVIGDSIPAFKKIQSESVFVGSAIVLKGDIATFELFVPTKAVTVVRDALQPLFDKE